ncbi:MAG: hypothetical protein LBC85_01185 [Fibromonadaceae bacterium]|jgi:hypothetical protein|nr:hypothetical protein [Fibromonadaceae bacterium]
MKKITTTLIVLFALTQISAEVLKPHFTEESKKIIIPQDARVFPEIHDGIITINYGWGYATAVREHKNRKICFRNEF